MNNERRTGDAVFAGLKRGLRAGAYGRLERLETAEIAARLEVSTTPVREAVMRLVGEGMLEPHPRGGVRPTEVSEARLRRLFVLHADLIGLALDRNAAPLLEPPAEPDGSVEEDGAAALFSALVARTDDPDLAWLVERLDDRLAPFRRIEDEVLGHDPAEVDELRAAAAKSAGDLKRALRRFYRRRIAAAAALVWRAAAGVAETS